MSIPLLSSLFSAITIAKTPILCHGAKKWGTGFKRLKERPGGRQGTHPSDGKDSEKRKGRI